jgi:hypothetical protein
VTEQTATGPEGAPTGDDAPGADDAAPRARCVLCREPTKYPPSAKGAVLCPVCAWQEAQRTACSG